MSRLLPRPSAGRVCGVQILLAALALALSLPAAAHSATTFGEEMIHLPTAGNAGLAITRAYNADGSLNAGSPVGGVLTSVNVLSTGNASNGFVRVIRRQTLFSGGYADFVNVAESIPWSVGADASAGGHVTTIPTRRTISAGDQLALVNSNSDALMYFSQSAPADCAFSSGSATPGTTATYQTVTCNHWIPLVQGVVEPDADADGYGDETQDDCPTNASSQTDCPPAGTFFVGDDMAGYPTWVNAGATVTRSINDDGTNYTGFPYSGILTSVQIRSAGGAGAGVVNVLRNTSPVTSFPISFLNVGPDIPFSVAAAAPPGGAITTVATRQPVAIGDRFGLVNNSVAAQMFFIASGAGDCVYNGSPPHAAGAVLSYTNAGCNNRIPLVRGVVEPDGDGDGYGDVSQDLCPADATAHDPCPQPAAPQADLSITLKRARRPARGLRATLSVTVANRGPSTAENVIIRLDRSSRLKSLGFLRGVCRVSTNKRSCTLASLASGAKITVKARAVKRMSGKISLVSRVSSSTTDPSTRNNRSSLRVRFSR